MVRLIACLLFAVALAAPAPRAAAQIAEPDRRAALGDAFALLQSAPREDAAAAAEAEIWALWFIGPDAESTARLSDAATNIRQGSFGAAMNMLDQLLAAAPNFAEAWNQRAFARFLAGDLEGSLADIAEVLKREPRHFGALAGRARIEARMGRMMAASRTMGEVAAVHPWMARRSAIPADPAAPPPGEDL